MKKSVKKITLRRETLLQLQPAVIAEVGGGSVFHGKNGTVYVSDPGGGCTVPVYTPYCL